MQPHPVGPLAGRARPRLRMRPARGIWWGALGAGLRPELAVAARRLMRWIGRTHLRGESHVEGSGPAPLRDYFSATLMP
eukprot:15068997-Alexandrium_andersonii.AAC.1